MPAPRPPLPDRVRPLDLDQIVGQERWLAAGAPLRRALDEGGLRSLVLWGPPGCGKTTLARALQAKAGLPWARLSAVLDGVKELRDVLAGAEARRRIDGKPTLVFVDEIHRWNKAQQDALLPEVESGGVVLVGATTENPSFYLNAALRSRLLVVRLEPLADDQVLALLRRALADPQGLPGVSVPDEVLTTLASLAAGDARRALDDLERVVDGAPRDEALTAAVALRILERTDIRHDRTGDDHHDVVSALIKSMRGSDPEAAIYWLARMLHGG
jgi:putative ATPase